MNIRDLTAICMPLVAFSNAYGQEKPNILFIYADDQCYESLFSQEKYDNDISTPNLDRLMKNGTAFVQAHNQGGWSAGVSVASRTMMVTGQYLWRAAQTSPTSKVTIGGPNNPPRMPEYSVTRREHEVVWPELMREAGYETYMAGKWHISNLDPNKVFDHTGEVRGGMPGQHQDCYDRVFDGVTVDKWTPYDTSYGGFWKGGKHWSEVLKDDAVGFLNHSKDIDKPFFMYIAFNAAHDPRQSPKEFVDMYPAEEISVPDNFLTQYPYADEIGAGEYLRDEKLAPFPRNEMSVKVNRQEYYAIISHMDEQIGEILEVLESTGQADNTYIIFTADHGIAIGDHGFMGKQNMYEKSVRVPLIVSGPDVEKNKKVEEYVYLQDVMPTALDIAGVEKPANVDYHTLMPLATGKSKKSDYDYVYGAYLGVQRMVKGDGYKMIIYPNINMVRLFNLKKDPSEMVDLANNPKYKSTMTKLFTELQRLQAEVEDPLDVSSYFNTFMDKL